MQYYMDKPMRCEKYENSKYSYRETLRFPSSTYLNTQRQRIVFPLTVDEFDSFTLRENALSFAFFANKKDPEMDRILSILENVATNIHKLIVVDVGILPELGIKYEIKRPTLLKLYKGHVVRFFEQEFTYDCIRKFTSAPSTARWRQPNIR